MRYSILSVLDHYPGRPRSVGELYEQVLVQGELAEALGYEAYFVAEHHFHEYGAVPNPAVLLATMAQRTRWLRLGTAISVLTFHNPLTVAETYAMLDVLSGGRLVLGVGSGYLKHEFEGFRIDPAEKRERFDEALEVLQKALTGERFSYRGKHIRIDNVAINVTPLQRPTPPIYVAVLRREAAYHIGRRDSASSASPMRRSMASTTSARSWRSTAKARATPGSRPARTTSISRCIRMSRSTTPRPGRMPPIPSISTSQRGSMPSARPMRTSCVQGCR